MIDSKIRIIGGHWKRSVIPVANTPTLRPTPNRVRETVFNWLNYLIDSEWHTQRCLDLFAGTGILGFEAASRGAMQVTLVEQNATLIHALTACQTRFHAKQVQIEHNDALDYLHQQDNRFDLIFIDPPYHQGWLPKILPLCLSHLVPHGFLYVESEFHLQTVQTTSWMNPWTILRANQAGKVFYHVCTPNHTHG